MRFAMALLGAGMWSAIVPASAGEANHPAIAGLMGTTMFAARYCETFTVNTEKFSTFLKGFGADANDTDLVDSAGAIKVERDLEKRGDPVGTCDTLWRRFGPQGSVGARLFRPK